MRGSRPAVEGLLPQPDFGPRAQGGPSAPGRMNIWQLGPLTASTRTEGAVGLAEGSSTPLHSRDVRSPLSQVVV